MNRLKPVQFAEERLGPVGTGIVELNTPQALNAIFIPGYELIETQLKRWAKDPSIGFVVLRGAGGKAFCAGGDVKSLVLGLNSEGLDVARRFFTLEYFIDYWIHVFPKPVVALWDGITMGGGIGLGHGATVRVVTERTLMAMPEVTIGLFPDVGATQFLGRLKDGVGLYLGLTGRRFSGVDAVEIGLADVFVPSNLLNNVMADLLRMEWQSDSAANSERLREYFKRFPKPEGGELMNDFKKLQPVFELQELLEIDERLKAAGGISAGIDDSIQRFQSGSPTSRAVFHQAYRKHGNLPLREVFEREWDMAMAFSKTEEFCEGVRALLIDKDQKPKWNPPDLASAIKNAEKYFDCGETNLLREKIAEEIDL